MTENPQSGKALIQEVVEVSGIFRATALDIDTGGIYLATPGDVIQGAVLEMSFRLGGSPLKVRGTVSRVDQGVGVHVSFSGLTPEQTAVIRTAMGKSAGVPEAGAKKKILLVDDSAQSRSIYRSKLTQEGFAVAEAENGVEALRRLQEVKPDLVLLDLWMEGIDGFKILQLMGMNPELKQIPVVVLSARVVPADIEKVRSLGARDYLPKMTTSPLKLVQKVKEVLSIP